MPIVPTQLLGFADGGMSQGLLSSTDIRGEVQYTEMYIKKYS